MLRSNFDIWIDQNLNDLGIGLLFICVGIISAVFGKYIHKKYQGQGYKLFRPFRREGKTQEEDNFFAIMFLRSLGVIIFGSGFVLFGLYKIFEHFLNK